MTNVDGTWIEELNEDGALLFKYFASGFDAPRIVIYCCKVPKSNNVWKIFSIEGDDVDYNLAPEMMSILENKIKSMVKERLLVDWSASFWVDKMLSYVKRIGEIENKHKFGIELTTTDIEFIYRLVDFWIKRPWLDRENFIKLRKDPDSVIKQFRTSDYISFGLSPDSRMDEIVAQRNHQSDFDKLGYNSKLVFLQKYDFNDVKVSESELVIKSRKIYYASDDLLKDTSFVRKFMASHPNIFILPYTKPNINKNRNIVLLQLDGLVALSIDDFLKYVSPKLQDDEEIVKRSLMLNGNNIKYASNRLKNDRSMVIFALLNGCELKEENFPLSMLVTYPEIKHIVDVIDIINVYYKINDAEVKRVLSNNILMLIKHSPPELKSNYRMMKKIFAINSETFNFASSKVQNKLKGR